MNLIMVIILALYHFGHLSHPLQVEPRISVSAAAQVRMYRHPSRERTCDRDGAGGGAGAGGLVG